MSDSATRVLFDEPGPRGRRLIATWSVAIGLALLGLIALAAWQFYVHDQLDPYKWAGFLHPAILRFLGQGILGTFQATLMAASRSRWACCSRWAAAPAIRWCGPSPPDGSSSSGRSL